MENELSWTLEGLEKFTNYCIQIAGFNSKGGGNLSDWVCALTDEDGKLCTYLTETRCRLNS